MKSRRLGINCDDEMESEVRREKKEGLLRVKNCKVRQTVLYLLVKKILVRFKIH